MIKTKNLIAAILILCFTALISGVVWVWWTKEHFYPGFASMISYNQMLLYIGIFAALALGAILLVLIKGTKKSE